jgi:cellulose synthase operon protein C
VAALLAAVAIEAARWGHARLQGWNATRAIFTRACAPATRPLEARLAYPLADRHRPVGPGCGPESRALLYQHQDLAELERQGDRHGLASVYALSCDPRRARRLLHELMAGDSPDAANDLAALSLDLPDGAAQALRHLDDVLRGHPRHPQALWNRGLVLASLSLPLAAARSFRAVEALGEPGWSGEAGQRAARLEQAAANLVRAEAEGERAVAGIEKAVVPSEDVIARHPEAARIRFYVAARARTGAALADLLPVAQAIDKVQARLQGQAGSSSPLTQMVQGAVDLNRMFALTRPPLLVDKAREYQRLAAITSDPWQEIRGWQLLGRAQAAARNFAPALQAFDRALALCRERRFPDVCAETKVWLALHHSDRYQLQPARALALEAKRDSQAHGLAWWDVEANRRLQRLEDFRQEFGLARAYAEENSLRRDDCGAAQMAREYLAEMAMQQGQPNQARQELAAVGACGKGQPVRFDMTGLSVLGALIRDPAVAGQELSWWTESLAWHRAQHASRAPLEQTTILLIEGRALIERDPARAEKLLDEVIARSDAAGRDDAGAETKRTEAFSTLITAATARGAHDRALQLLARALRVQAPATCLVGAVAESNRRAYLARGGEGPLVGVHAIEPAGGDARDVGGAVLPKTIAATVSACPRVDVLATVPFFGRARLLPEHIAWGYLSGGNLASPAKARTDRLIVQDVATPAALDLPRLARQATPASSLDENIISVSGAQATPAEVVRRLGGADVIELHVHGLLDRNVSDAPSLVLSPDRSGLSLLTAREIEGLRLDRRPGVILGACDVGQSAHYWSLQHSLPAAFIQAGAGWVLASPAPVADADAGPFFDRVWRRTKEGAVLAVALRDERQSPRWESAESDWVRHVVAFY